ncbi:MAG: sulfotransferase domain-containing protein [Deinococcota bacterium]
MNARIIVVNSHRRSGTHLLIDALCHNVERAVFPAHRKLPKDFNIGSLFRKDPDILQVFKRVFAHEGTVVVKSHLLPEEMNITPQDPHEQLIRDVFDIAKHLYVYRDPRDTLRSLAGLLDDEQALNNFIDSPNDHFSPSRIASEVDSTRTRYWAHHLAAWRDTPGVHLVKFEALRTCFDDTMNNVMAFLEEPEQASYTVPRLPKNQLWHRVLLKANKLGLISSVPSSAIRPGKGQVGGAKVLFDETSLAKLQADIDRYNLGDLVQL